MDFLIRKCPTALYCLKETAGAYSIADTLYGMMPGACYLIATWADSKLKLFSLGTVPE